MCADKHYLTLSISNFPSYLEHLQDLKFWVTTQAKKKKILPAKKHILELQFMSVGVRN